MHVTKIYATFGLSWFQIKNKDDSCTFTPKTLQKIKILASQNFVEEIKSVVLEKYDCENWKSSILGAVWHSRSIGRIVGFVEALCIWGNCGHLGHFGKVRHSGHSDRFDQFVHFSQFGHIGHASSFSLFGHFDTFPCSAIQAILDILAVFVILVISTILAILARLALMTILVILAKQTAVTPNRCFR